MRPVLESAKNASLTCSVDGRFLHSKYNPENEAKNFVGSISCSYVPSCLIITGASLPYCIPFLNERFPNTPIYSIQYSDFFYDIKDMLDTTQVFKQWTQSFICTQETCADSLSEQIFSSLGEMVLSSSLIVSWKAGDEAYINESTIAWKALHLLLQKSRDVLATRSYFSFRWLKNTLRFCLQVTNTVMLQKQEKPVLLVASGPSLMGSLDYIKKEQSSFFIIALSSALCTLIHNNIIPDLCISTDGGYHAKSHLYELELLYSKGYKVPLAISSESNVNSRILSDCDILPLTYSDGIESNLFQAFGIQAFHAERNGTVSGTASMLALSITDKEVYALGLDLAVGNGYSHCQPNAHEGINALHDFRLRPQSQRLAASILSNSKKGMSALDLYRQWFETRDRAFSERFFRVFADGYSYSNSLGLIKDISISQLQNKMVSTLHTKRFSFYPTKVLTDNRKKILSAIVEREKNSPNQQWIELCALSEYIAMKKYPNEKKYRKKLEKKLQECFEYIEGLCT